MPNDDVREVQGLLVTRGHDIAVDGRMGPRTLAAMIAELRADDADSPPPALAWGARVSPAFRARVREIAARKGTDPSYLMACMAFETGERFTPDVRNAAGSGAVGLIQFMPTTAQWLGTSAEALAGMSAEQQLDWVDRYFQRITARPLPTLSDVYMAILLPSAIGKPEGAALFSQGAAYRQNAGLDRNRDGVVTKAEATARVQAKLERGLLPELRA